MGIYLNYLDLKKIGLKFVKHTYLTGIEISQTKWHE